MTIVINTSVIVKWFVNEDGHEEAVRLLQSGERRPLLTPVTVIETLELKLFYY